ncbi:SAUR-like auxin-responsive protein family [Euphorbia peplus]|nr:SAUR-like auxin-responsive protein family [Euphorbia peplus]
MIITKSFHKTARKWLQLSNSNKNSYSSKDSCAASRGHFVVYSSEWKRFVIPLSYLNYQIFQKLFQMSEEEFGWPSEGPIRLPCDSLYIDYVVRNIQKGLEKNLIDSLSSTGYLPMLFVIRGI